MNNKSEKTLASLDGDKNAERTNKITIKGGTNSDAKDIKI